MDPMGHGSHCSNFPGPTVPRFYGLPLCLLPRSAAPRAIPGRPRMERPQAARHQFVSVDTFKVYIHNMVNSGDFFDNSWQLLFFDISWYEHVISAMKNSKNGLGFVSKWGGNSPSWRPSWGTWWSTIGWNPEGRKQLIQYNQLSI
jgi:hypothetical protein